MEATGIAFFVRDHYNMLPTDPAWLAMDEGQVLDEAMVLIYHRFHQDRLANPGYAAATEPGAVEEMQAEARELRTDTAKQADFLSKLSAAYARLDGRPQQPTSVRAKLTGKR